MSGKRGRPPKSAETGDTKQNIIAAAVDMIRRHGADDVTVRTVGSVMKVLQFYKQYGIISQHKEVLVWFIRK